MKTITITVGATSLIAEIDDDIVTEITRKELADFNTEADDLTGKSEDYLLATWASRELEFIADNEF